MLQSWNKFCFSSGLNFFRAHMSPNVHDSYIEVAIVLPGPNENTQGYVSSNIFVTSLFPFGIC